MENINSLRDLYILLKPVFKVKRRLLKYSCFDYINDKDIWNFLTEYKWKKQYNLTLSEIVDDIINIDNVKIDMYLEERKYEKVG